MQTINSKVKKKREKYVRLPKNEVMDLIFNLFKRYRAWGLRSIRDELKQPESYLKELLQEIAILQRSGDLVNTYVLKPEWIFGDEEFRRATDGVAPGREDSDGDDEDVGEMEDVKLEK